MEHYQIEIEHIMTVEREDVTAKDVNNLRKNLIKRFTPKRGWNEYTVVVYKYNRPIQTNYPNTPDYLGTMYLYFDEEGGKICTWAVNSRSRWGDRRHLTPGATRYDISVVTGKLTRKR